MKIIFKNALWINKYYYIIVKVLDVCLEDINRFYLKVMNIMIMM